MENVTPLKRLLTIDEVAAIIQYTRNGIYNALIRNPDAIPPPMKRKSKKGALRWHPDLVDSWLRERAGLLVSPEAILPVQKRGPGRPRKEGGVK